MDIGLDLGFHSTKAICGERWARFPSFVTRPAESLFSLNGHGQIMVQSGYGCYLVGEEAVKKGLAGARKETAEWIASPEYVGGLFYGALSELTLGTAVSVSLVTGLPLADYARDKGALRERLQGVHRFEREGRRGQTVTVESVRVVPQAWGVVLALLLDDRGRIVCPELADSKVAVIDVGGHTVNYLSVDGLSDIPSESKSTERGAWNVVRAVREYLDQAHPGLARLRDHRLMEAVIAGEIYDQGLRVDLAPVVRPILDDVGQEIVDTAGQYWGPGAATFRQVIVCGGGAYLWGAHVRRAFRQAMVMEQPEMANARGFYRFAVHIGG
ncbi:MAG TPA: ParM/StbA family protein [Anaerolineae bacterium]|nr:ParM/StbA family protein [Anaerolineae bacterium]